MTDYTDLPRDELQRLAQQRLDEFKGLATVLFKFTCAVCGTRCTLREPNTLHEKGLCDKCGYETVIEKGGFMLIMSMTKEDAAALFLSLHKAVDGMPSILDHMARA